MGRQKKRWQDDIKDWSEMDCFHFTIHYCLCKYFPFCDVCCMRILIVFVPDKFPVTTFSCFMEALYQLHIRLLVSKVFSK